MISYYGQLSEGRVVAIPFFRCSKSMFWQNSGETPVSSDDELPEKLWWNSGGNLAKRVKT